MATTNLDALALEGALSVGGALTVTGLTTLTGALSAKMPVEVGLVNGAITIKHGLVPLTKAGVAAMTLAAPTAGTDDGKVLYIVAITANAHTVTVAGGYNGTASTIGTFGGAVGDGVCLVAYNAKWYIVPGTNLNVTLS